MAKSSAFYEPKIEEALQSLRQIQGCLDALVECGQELVELKRGRFNANGGSAPAAPANGASPEALKVGKFEENNVLFYCAAPQQIGLVDVSRNLGYASFDKEGRETIHPEEVVELLKAYIAQDEKRGLKTVCSNKRLYGDVLDHCRSQGVSEADISRQFRLFL